MHAYIVSGGDIDTRAKYIADLAIANTLVVHLQAEKTKLTIKQVRDLIESLSISSPTPRLVWIEEAQQLTLPAQNALLKILEEPPQSTTFYLTSPTKTSLVPTIVSRCLHITLTNPGSDPSAPILRELKAIMALSPGDRLAASVKRDRTESMSWIIAIEQSLSLKLKDPTLTSSNFKTLGKIARLALAAHAQLAANCNISLVTQHFLLSLPKTK